MVWDAYDYTSFDPTGLPSFDGNVCGASVSPFELQYKCAWDINSSANLN